MDTKQEDFRGVRLLLVLFCVTAVIIAGLCVSHRNALPEGVGRVLSEEERSQVIARNSSLIDYVYLSPNATFPREGTISKITIHHMAADLTLENLGESFGQEDRRASANYAIDSQGRIALYVEEQNQAWTSSSAGNDSRAVTIEVANDEIGGVWHVSNEAYDALLTLCTDICGRNGMRELRFTGDASGTLTIHSMFSSTTDCPGPYLESRMPEIAEEVTRRLQAAAAEGGNTAA